MFNGKTKFTGKELQNLKKEFWDTALQSVGEDLKL